MVQTVFLFILLHFLVSDGLIEAISELKSAQFVSSLAIQEFGWCTLVFVSEQVVKAPQTKSEIPGTQVISFSASSTVLPIYNLQIPNYSNSSFMSNINSSILNDYDILKSKLKSANTITNKHSDSCKLVILIVTHLENSQLLFSQITQMITPAFTPLVKKNSDHFIFVTDVSIIDKVLLSVHLPSKIKYKLALGEAHESALLEVQSVCFFCNEGRPSIVKYPAQISSEIVKEFNYFPDHLKNMMGKTLRISCPAILPRIETRKPWLKTELNNAKRGIWKNLFHDYFMDKFNFTYNSFLSTGKDGNFGGGGTGLELPNGTWIGVAGDLINGKADAGVICAPTLKRLHKITFTNSFFEPVFLTFITTHGQRVYSPQALLWPFNIFMWLLIFVSTVFAFAFFGFLTKAMMYLNLSTDSNMSYSRRGVVIKEIWGLELQVFFVTTSYLDQTSVMPRFTPLRCFVALWLFYVLILTTVYRSKMVSLLAYPLTNKVPSTFEKLSTSGYEIGFMKHGDAAYNVLKGSNDPVYVRIVKDMHLITGAGVECMERIISRKKYACIAYNVSATYLNARNFSDFESQKFLFSPDSTYIVYLGIAFESGSIYQESFDKFLGWVRAFHLQYVWELRDLENVKSMAKKWWRTTNQNEKFQRVYEKDFSDLTLKHVSGCFYAVFIGLLLGIVSFIAEVLFAFWKKRQGSQTVLNVLEMNFY